MPNATKNKREVPLELSPEALIEIWAARCCGSQLEETPRWLLASLRSGGVGPDETATAMMHYVESVPTFRWARPALVWAHIRGRSPQEYLPSRPGESYRAALIRVGWGEFLSLAPRRLCQAVLDSFDRALKDQMQIKPFVPPRPVSQEFDAEAVAEQVSAEVDNSLDRARSLANSIRSRRTRE